MKRILLLIGLQLYWLVSFAVFCSCQGHSWWSPHHLTYFTPTYYYWAPNEAGCGSGQYLYENGWVEVRNSFGEIVYDGDLAVLDIQCASA